VVKSIISLTGDLGSGKSTVSKLLCRELGFNHVYTGAIQRSIAERLGMTTTELNVYSETHPEIDAEIDETFKALNESSELIVDSRMAWFFIPDSFKVYLKTNIMVSAERIAKDTERKSEHYGSTMEAAAGIITRKTSENRRYAELYGADCSNPLNFNLVIDTSFVAPETVASIIIRELAEETVAKALLSPRNLYPTQRLCGDNDSHMHYINAYVKTHGIEVAPRPVTVADIDGVDYVINGHKRVSAALRHKIDLVPVEFVEPTSKDKKGMAMRERIRKSISPGLFGEWEKEHSFQYFFYPEFG
jgi:cytidylate kinase